MRSRASSEKLPHSDHRILLVIRCPTCFLIWGLTILDLTATLCMWAVFFSHPKSFHPKSQIGMSGINFFFCLYSGVAKRNWSESKDSIRAQSHSWRAFEAPAVGWVSRLEFLFSSDKVQSNRNWKSELPSNSLMARFLASRQNGTALFSHQSAVISHQLLIISLWAYLFGILK